MSEQLIDPFNFSKAKILVIGDIGLDTYWHGTTNRTSPEAPVPIALYGHCDNRLSGAGLIAAIIKHLGANVELLSALGSDNLAADTTASNQEINTTIRQLLINHQLGLENLINFTGDKKTEQQIRIVSQAQQLLRIDNINSSTVEDSLRFIESTDLTELNQKFSNAYKNYNIILFYDTGSGVVNHQHFNTWQDLAKNNNSMVIYMPSTKVALNKFVARQARADYIILNKKLNYNTESILMYANVGLLVHDNHCLNIYHKASNTVENIKFVECSVTNTTGTKEMLAAVFALGMSNDPKSLSLAGKLANAAVGFASRQFGQCLIDIIELQLAYADCLLDGKYNYIHLKQEIIAARDKGYKIVFVNGCFDILHIGHVSYLQAAKERGDKLFIAINSDCSIKRLKGSTRPINNLADRLLALKSLELQDWVVPFFTDTPEDFLRWLKPDLLLKGGDYTPEQIVGHEIVHSYGGKAEIVELYPNISSTKILEKLN